MDATVSQFLRELQNMEGFSLSRSHEFTPARLRRGAISLGRPGRRPDGRRRVRPDHGALRRRRHPDDGAHHDGRDRGHREALRAVRNRDRHQVHHPADRDAAVDFGDHARPDRPAQLHRCPAGRALHRRCVRRELWAGPALRLHHGARLHAQTVHRRTGDPGQHHDRHGGASTSTISSPSTSSRVRPRSSTARPLPAVSSTRSAVAPPAR